MMFACSGEICAPPCRCPLSPGLVDEPPRAHAVELLEDRPRARVDLQPRVARAAPAQVLVEHAVHAVHVAAR
jgi:hypothetical protein